VVNPDILVRFNGIAGKTRDWARCQVEQMTSWSARILGRSEVKVLDLRSGREAELMDF